MFRINAATLSLVLFAVTAFEVSGSSGAQAPAAATPAKLHAGEEIFTQKCHQCHAAHEGQYSFGPNLDGETKKPNHKSPAEIRAIIKDGKGKMPGFAAKLAPAEMDDLLVYIRSL